MSLFGDRKIGKDYVAPKSSVYGIQKATLFKRFAAFMLDTILTIILAVGVAYVTTIAIDYDSLSAKLEEKYIEHGVEFYNEDGSINVCTVPSMNEGETQEEYMARLEDDSCYKAYLAFNSDEEAVSLMSKSYQASLLIISVSCLLATGIVFFLFPLVFKNGQTIGMKIVHIGLISNKGIRVNFANVFLRWSMGIFVIETMIPIYCFEYILINSTNITTVALFLILLFATNLICFFVSPNKIFFHDLIGGTVICDMNTQVIANSLEEYEDNIKRENNSQEVK